MKPATGSATACASGASRPTRPGTSRDCPRAARSRASSSSLTFPARTVSRRFLTAAIKINNDLERMGDLAVNIVERALALMQQPTVKPLIDIPHMGKLVESMVRKSLDAFVRKDSDLARNVLASDDAVDDLRDTIYQELIRTMQEEPNNTPQCVNLMFVARNLERIADHATNIAEDVLFLVQGVDVRHHAAEKR